MPQQQWLMRSATPSMVPAIVCGTIAMLALAGVRLASADAVLLTVSLATCIGAARVGGTLGGTLGGSAGAIVAFVGALHGEATLATLAGAAVAIAPLIESAPRGTFRVLLLAATAAATTAFRPELATWSAAIVLYAVVASRVRASGRLGSRDALALNLATALVAAACVDHAAALPFVAIFAASNTVVIVRAMRGRHRDAGAMLDAAFPLLDAVVLAACGHPIVAIECVAVVPVVRRLALIDTFRARGMADALNGATCAGTPSSSGRASPA